MRGFYYAQKKIHTCYLIYILLKKKHLYTKIAVTKITTNDTGRRDMELKIEYVDKELLKPYANNAKIHSAEQIEQIKNSIRQFSFNDPIAV